MLDILRTQIRQNYYNYEIWLGSYILHLIGIIVVCFQTVTAEGKRDTINNGLDTVVNVEFRNLQKLKVNRLYM